MNKEKEEMKITYTKIRGACARIEKQNLWAKRTKHIYQNKNEENGVGKQQHDSFKGEYFQDVYCFIVNKFSSLVVIVVTKDTYQY